MSTATLTPGHGMATVSNARGNPVGVIRSVKPYTNLEMVCEWRHMKDAGNSGIFIWSPIETLDRLKGPGLPEGIECQVLDLGYTDAYVETDRQAAGLVHLSRRRISCGQIDNETLSADGPQQAAQFPN